jgi:hypothetical protein
MTIFPYGDLMDGRRIPILEASATAIKSQEEKSVR